VSSVESLHESVPAPVTGLLAHLRAAGHEAYLVGGCVRDLVRGVAVVDFDVATSAEPQVVLQLFPRAIPIGLRHGTVMVPTRSGPVDVTTFRAGPRLEDDLAHRDFTVNALAWEPGSGRVIDPFGGVADLEHGRLRAVGSPEDRMREDPLRALRAARLVATLGLRPDPELERAMPACAAPLATVARERVRRELELLLLAPQPGAGIALLRRTGLEAALLPAAPEAAPVVDALPADLPLRLAGWLRGSDAAAVLARLRFPRRVAARVGRLVAMHPIERGVDPERDVSVRRVMRRAGDEGLGALLALRDAELRASPGGPSAAAALAKLAALRQAIERVRRSGALALRRRDLALDGRAVMRILGCAPGPQVGRALDHLTEQVIRDPSCNRPEALRRLLEEWRARISDASPTKPISARTRGG
jgi:tRNA nucleotidyltransferase (CCA-adding enzyme)